MELLEGEQGWTGSRGSICQTLQSVAADSSNVTFHWHSRAEVANFETGDVLVSTLSPSGPATTTQVTPQKQNFDVIVAADGAGSRARRAMLAPQDVESFDNGNMSMMLAFDRKDEVAAELDASVLYVLRAKPVLCVAGAINGPGGKNDPLWFCQVCVFVFVPTVTTWLVRFEYESIVVRYQCCCCCS